MTWLKIIQRCEMLPAQTLEFIMPENEELCRIFTASLNTCRLTNEK